MKKKNYSPGPIVLDVEALVLNEQDKARIAHPLTGGVILFGRNFQNRQQLTTLTKAIKAVREDVLIAIDHEGGRVQRCKTDGFTHLPAMQRLGLLWSGKQLPAGKHTPQETALLAMKAATAVGYILACELLACGVDFSFTPVLDLDYGNSSVIGDRAFHMDPSIVSILARSLNHGLLLAGMKNCGKHFPGHGYAKADSHIEIPVDDRTLETILRKDAQPYSDLGVVLDAVMPAHVIYPKVDEFPAGFSKKWLQDILRRQMGFTGVIFSDDLSMEGASVMGNVVQGAQAAIAAGCDAVLICNSPAQVDQLLAHLRINEKLFAVSKQRLIRLFPTNPRYDWKTLQQEIQYSEAKMLLQSHGLISIA
jgi:beta-N-acetylhexosaminidase